MGNKDTKPFDQHSHNPLVDGPAVDAAMSNARYHTREEMVALHTLFFGVVGKPNCDREKFVTLLHVIAGVVLEQSRFWPHQNFGTIPGYYLHAFANVASLKLKAESDTMFTALDTDGSGGISFLEFAYACDLAKSLTPQGWGELIFRLFNRGRLEGGLDAVGARKLNNWCENVAETGIRFADFLKRIVQMPKFTVEMLGFTIPAESVLIETITFSHFAVVISGDATVQTLKEAIQDQEGIPPNQQWLFYLPASRDPLVATQTLASYGIVPGHSNARVHMLLPFRV